MYTVITYYLHLVGLWCASSQQTSPIFILLMLVPPPKGTVAPQTHDHLGGSYSPSSFFCIIPAHWAGTSKPSHEGKIRASLSQRRRPEPSCKATLMLGAVLPWTCSGPLCWKPPVAALAARPRHVWMARHQKHQETFATFATATWS